VSIIDRLATRILTKGIITHKNALSDTVFHIRIKSESFKRVSYVPGHFLRLFCGKDKAVGLKDKVRSYSVWNLDRELAEVDMAICTDSHGPGTAWAKECKVGNDIYFSWHQGKFVVDNTADHYLFVGDISTLGHFYEIRRNLPAGRSVRSLIYSNAETHFFPDIDGTTPFEFIVLPENPEVLLKKKIDSLALNIEVRVMVYVGGDSRICVSLHSYFKNVMKWRPDQIKIKPFWKPGKTGLE
jgi:NADPH-dependent ferric siderophore reductase